MKRFDLTARFLSLSVLVVMNAGCVSTSLYLASNHPARIDAPSGPAHSDPAAILHPDAPLYPSEGTPNTSRLRLPTPKTALPTGHVKRRMSVKVSFRESGTANLKSGMVRSQA